jgi:hypothetical protein
MDYRYLEPNEQFGGFTIVINTHAHEKFMEKGWDKYDTYNQFEMDFEADNITFEDYDQVYLVAFNRSLIRSRFDKINPYVTTIADLALINKREQDFLDNDIEWDQPGRHTDYIKKRLSELRKTINNIAKQRAITKGKFCLMVEKTGMFPREIEHLICKFI